MDGATIFVLAVAFLAFITIVSGVKSVPQGREWTVERFGRFTKVLKPGLNLSKRSQALRMHRRGEAPAQIAAALNIPSQEVELLIKVQRIVLSNMQSKATSQK